MGSLISTDSGQLSKAHIATLWQNKDSHPGGLKPMALLLNVKVNSLLRSLWDVVLPHTSCCTRSVKSLSSVHKAWQAVENDYCALLLLT